ncbi:DUF4328 domain-containing protein [Lentzea sp. NPDC051838]|uniref:DUF4328 domain-containing protein n=1 Tax=Lentzea sp. NPDC051838 TaxID=3154849 RepID=UPI00341B01E5
MEHFRPVRGLGLAACVLIGVVALGNVVEAVTDWLTYVALVGAFDLPASISLLITLDVVRVITDLPLTLVTIATLVVFILWMYNARVNAERFTYATEHRFARVWVVLGWLVPVVNLWFPKLIIDDIWRASDPQLRDIPLQQRPRTRLITNWWNSYLLMWVFDFAYFRFYEDGQLTEESFVTQAAFSTMCAVIGGVAAYLAVQVVRRISDFQSSPLPAPSSSD